MTTPDDLLAAYFDTVQPHGPFNDEQIDAIALLLARCSHALEKTARGSPRTYIVLRTIGQRDLLPLLLSQEFDDNWFPVTSRRLPSFLDPRVRNSILQAQHIILTKSLDLENGRHCHYDSTEVRPFDVEKVLGSGAFGQVRVITSRISHKQYALKTINRRAAYGTKSRQVMSDFKAEMEIMKRLQHIHIVRYIGSYTDRRDLGLLMSPVAECDLGAYLEKACQDQKSHATLRTFFGCLATALSYLHDQGIKHRDIKPQNILVQKANVLLADFGISHDFLDTTTGPTILTQRYCSPEVATYEGRNAGADVWSLGCVFLEMQSALQAKDLGWLRSFYEANGTGSTHYHANPLATHQLLSDWQTASEAERAQPVAWIGQMLVTKRQFRPTAAEIMNRITASDNRVGFMYSCDHCCDPPSDLESVRGLEEDVYNEPEPMLDSNKKQAAKAVAIPKESLDSSLDASWHTGPSKQTRAIDDSVDSPKGISSLIPTVTNVIDSKVGIEKIDTPRGPASSLDPIRSHEMSARVAGISKQTEQQVNRKMVGGRDNCKAVEEEDVREKQKKQWGREEESKIPSAFAKAAGKKPTSLLSYFGDKKPDINLRKARQAEAGSRKADRIERPQREPELMRNRTRDWYRVKSAPDPDGFPVQAITSTRNDAPMKVKSHALALDTVTNYTKSLHTNFDSPVWGKQSRLTNTVYARGDDSCLNPNPNLQRADNLGLRASALDTKSRRTDIDSPGSEKQLRLTNTVSAREKTLRPSIDPNLQRADEHPVEANGPGIDDLYRDVDGFSKGPFTFSAECQSFSLKCWIPNLVVYCARQIILETVRTRSEYSHSLLENTSQSLTQSRFDFLRDQFRTDSIRSVMKWEAPLLFCKYLDCLALPIIPEDALRNWPDVYHAHGGLIILPVLESCFVIRGLKRSRRNLLLYLLLYMANYAPSDDTAVRHTRIEALVGVYGPYICGTAHQKRAKHILMFLVKNTGHILSEIANADGRAVTRMELIRRIAIENGLDEKFGRTQNREKVRFLQQMGLREAGEKKGQWSPTTKPSFLGRVFGTPQRDATPLPPSLRSGVATVPLSTSSGF